MKRIFTPFRNLLSAFVLIASIWNVTNLNAQCDITTEGVMTYCNALGNPGSSYYVAFRALSFAGDTLDVVDLTGQVPDNQGKRIDDIVNELEPDNFSVQQLMIGGGADTVEYWYFGPFASGTPFHVVLVDPNDQCDTVFIASGTYDCADNLINTDPGACVDADNVPLYFLDFSSTLFTIGGGDGVNENLDEIFLVMSRTRENNCCDLQPVGQSCFEFIVRLGDNDIGLVIDDIGSGSPGGELYADSLSGFMCTDTVDVTWPFQQGGGQSSEVPLCLTGEQRDWIVLSCKSGGNKTSVSIDAITSLIAPPKTTVEPCDVILQVFGADTARWSSPDDPTLANFVTCSGDSTSCDFLYDEALFGPVTACLGDTFVYIVGARPEVTQCFNIDTILYDTTYVVVYPTFDVQIDTTCTVMNDSLFYTANVEIVTFAVGCEYDYLWSTGDTTSSITVIPNGTEYYVTVTRVDLPIISQLCVSAIDSVSAFPIIIPNCTDVQDQSLSCIEDLPDPDVNLVTFDGCGGAPLIFPVDVDNGGAGCIMNPLIVTRYYIIDFDGDTINTTSDRDTCPQVFTVIDDEPPVIVMCAANVTIECTDSTAPANTGVSTATDNCPTPPTVTSADVTVAGNCPQQYTIQRTWTATDACGNTDTCLQTITIEDSTPPTIMCAANVTIECDESTDPTNTGTSTATDNCDPAPVVTSANVTVAGNCPQEYTIQRTWTATDACGNASTCLQIITVDDSTPPTITCAVNVTIECTESTDPANTGTSTATDNCDPAPVVTSADVTVAGNCPQEYTIQRTWTATDACGNASTCLQTITIDDSTPPVLTCAANVTIECTESTAPANTGTSTATDNCDPAPFVTSADVTVAGSCPQEYTIQRTWTATDACGNASTCLQTITVDDSTPPTITCAVNVTIECTESTDPANTGISTATDNCDPAPVITSTDVTVAGNCPQEYTIQRTWTATDACGNASTCLQTITVDDSTPPTITCAANVTIECTESTDSANTGTSTATDNCDPAPVVTSADVTVAGNCPQEYTIQRTWTATDACGNASTCLQTITIDDSTPPTITCAANVTIECTESTDPANTGSSTATDNCDPAPFVTSADVIVAGNCPQEYTIQRTWTATDACGNTSTCLQTIIVDDSTPPTITCAANVTIECTESSDPVNTGSSTATDNCDPAPVVTSEDVTVAGNCPQEYTIQRTWTATDACGNASTCLQIITVDDSTPPTITCAPNVTIECTESTDPANTGSSTATDNCDPAPFVTSADVTVAGNCPQEYTIQRTWTATDACGNASTCLQTIIIDDSTPPTITCAPNVTIECTDSTDPANTGTSTATDNCDPAPVVTFADVTTGVDCSAGLERVWTATDACGNSSSCTQLISIEDSTPPIITCAANVTIECTDSTAPANTGTSIATDNCDPAPAVTSADVTVAGSCPQEYIIQRTWTATDICGNASTCLQTITVDDSTPPIITCAANVTIECTESTAPANTGTSTATDNCDPAPVVTSADVTVAGNCPQEYTIQRTWTATDACGNASTCLQTITIDDSTPPVITCAANVTIECTESTDPANTGTSTATDNCDPTPVVTSADVTVAGSCPQEYVIQRTWTATDACGNASTCLQTITIDDSTPPVITCAANVTIECTESTDPTNTGTSTATDNCDPAPVVTSADVIVAGNCPQEYTIQRTWTATDACGNASTCLQTITIDDSTPPVITCAANVTIECTESTDPMNTGASTATDNCDPAPVVTSADVTFAGNCPQEYTIQRTWTATDACGNASTCLQTITVDDSTPPIITCAANVTIECTESTAPANTGTSTATDNCDPAPVVTSADVTVAGNCPQEYTIQRTWTATDACGNASTCLQTITIDDSTPPVITCAANVTIECTESTDPANTGTSTATDNCDPTPVVTSADVTVAGSCPQEYVIQRTWTATDACGNASTCLQTITIDDSTPPVITCAANVTIECTESTDPTNTGTSTATDNCDPAPVVTSADVTVAGNCPQEYTIQRTWTATDACGNASTCLQTITIDDNTPPTITCAADVTIECTESTDPMNTGASTATDNCDPAPVVTSADVTVAGNCAQEYTIERTWTATDACGNASTCLQTISVEDSTEPEITCPPYITIDFGDSADPDNTGMATATDNCDPAPEITYEDVTIEGMCSFQYSIERTWTVTDACGNESEECVQNIFVDGGCIVDLALEKEIQGVQFNYHPGDDVSYIITVTNEGEVALSSITVIDYIPVGMMLNDPNWTPGTSGSTGLSASIELSIANGDFGSMGFLSGESVVIEITLSIGIDVMPGTYTNASEITGMIDVSGTDVTDDDIDSTADEDDLNDPEEEDDHDTVYICIVPNPIIEGDLFVCPGEIVVYELTSLYNPNNNFNWSISENGVILEDNGSSIAVQWGSIIGGPYIVSLTEHGGMSECVGYTEISVYVQGADDMACNDHINLSLDSSCVFQILSGMILEGELEGANHYFVVLTDAFGNVIPNATITGEHVGQTITAMVVNECLNQENCWGTIYVEDKIAPEIECPCPVDAEPLTFFTGTLNDDSPTWTRPFVTGGNCSPSGTGVGVPYETFDFYVEMISSSSFEVVTFTAPSADSYLALYAGSFDPTDPCANLVVADDDGGGGFLSEVTAELEAGIQYILVVTTFNNNGNDFGDFVVEISGEAMIMAGAPVCLINCTEAAAILAGNVPSGLVPTATDGCGEPTLEILNIESDLDDCEGGNIVISWIATDGSGNTATCDQVFVIVPLTLTDLEFPGTYEGDCGGSTSPTVTGYPTAGGFEIGEQTCNLFTAYWDKPIADCGGGTKIVRSWTVVDWCSQIVREGTQVIKLYDNEGPEMACPADMEVGTDFWYCYANVSIPKPTVTDACGSGYTLSLSSDQGVVAAFGGNHTISELPLGVTTVIWTAIDDCGNASTCSFTITVRDDVPPVPNCDEHTIVTLSNDAPYGTTLVSADVFDDGSYDNCSEVTLEVRRMTTCIDFDWTTAGACIDDVPNGIYSRLSDGGMGFAPCVPFACCDAGQGPIMVELKVTDAAGNENFCMVEIEVQDKLAPFIECPPNIVVSCDFWFDSDVVTGQRISLDEDPMTPVFGTVIDAYEVHDDQSARQHIVINDPGNDQQSQPKDWGIDGWADDNCDVTLDVKITIEDDCSGDDLPSGAPDHAIRYIERRFTATDGQDNNDNCRQKIWVVDFDPFYIADEDCNDGDRNDGIKWPCDELHTTCPDVLEVNEPVIYDDNCSLVAVTYEDTRFDFVDGACYKILREWKVIDWCQYDASTGAGLWTYTQVIKVIDSDGPVFTDCPAGPVTLCLSETLGADAGDEGVSLPANNQVFLGEADPDHTYCSVHLKGSLSVEEFCSDYVIYDVKVYPFNGSTYYQLVDKTQVSLDENGLTELPYDTEKSPVPSIKSDGLPYNSPFCGDYHKILWSVEDGCGNITTCEYLVRLEDCKQPTPVCVNGLSTVVMPVGGTVTIWASEYDVSSIDDCTHSDDLLFSFSGDTYQPSREWNCDNVDAFGAELSIEVWVADEGTDHNCNGQITWDERNKDYCTTTIVITDNDNTCGGTTLDFVIAGEVMTHADLEPVELTTINLSHPTHVFPSVVTVDDGKYAFTNVPAEGLYTITPNRNDDHDNGVSTLDLVRMQKHLLGIEPFTSAYQYIAADANNTESVSALDLVDIRKLILGIYSEFPSNSSWRFVDSKYEFGDVTNPWPFNESITVESLETLNVEEDFMAVKVGDLNNTVVSNANQVVIRGARAESEVKVEGPDYVTAGEEVNVTMTLSQEMIGLQWTLDMNGLVYTGMESDRLTEENVALHGKTQQLTLSYARTEADGEIMITLQFIAKTDGKLSDKLSLSNDITETEGYVREAEDIEIVDLALVFGDQEEVQEYALYQNEPNPMSDFTAIRFDLPIATSATLTLFDSKGQVIRTIDGDYNAGSHVVRLEREDLIASGIYYYRLDADGFSASKKLVVSK